MNDERPAPTAKTLNDANPFESTSRRRPKMTDVARLAGVSQSSVSLVLNGMTGARLSDSTRYRVMQAARRLGYQLPSRAGEPPAGRTIAFVIDEISTGPHPVVNLDGVRDEAWESDLLVTTHVTRSNAELEATTLDAVRRAPTT
jgi:LacI family transcriptional regulator